MDEDDGNNFCVPGSDSTLIHINGCFSSDEDFDGQSYQLDWPGTDPNVRRDRALHPIAGPVHEPAHEERPSELLHGRLRGRSAADRGVGLPGQPAVLRPDDGRELREPAERRAVLSLLLDADCERHLHVAGGWPVHPGTTNDFGGSSTSEYGPLLSTVYPTRWAHGPRGQFNNFNSGDLKNPCPVQLAP